MVGQRIAGDCRDQLLGDEAKFGVASLGHLDEDTPGLFVAQAERGHQDSAGEVDDRPAPHRPSQVDDLGAQVLLVLPVQVRTGTVRGREQRCRAGEHEQPFDRVSSRADMDRLALGESKAPEAQQDPEAGTVAEVDPREVEIQSLARLGQGGAQAVLQRLRGIDVDLTGDDDERPWSAGYAAVSRKGDAPPTPAPQASAPWAASSPLPSGGESGCSRMAYRFTPDPVTRQEIHELSFTLLNA